MRKCLLLAAFVLLSSPQVTRAQWESSRPFLTTDGRQPELGLYEDQAADSAFDIGLRPASVFTTDQATPLVSDESVQPEPAVQSRRQLLHQRPQKKHTNSGFIDINTYWDSREFTETTLNLGAKLPHKLEYFQFINLTSPPDSSSTDGVTYFTEFNLRRPIDDEHELLKPFDWTIQYADGSIPEGVGRLGIRWRLHDTPGPFGAFFKDVLKLNYSLTFHVLESDNDGWQIEHFYRRTFCDELIYIAGFVDHNINNQWQNSTWVTEHQIGVRLFDNWHAVAEYRYSSFAPSRFKSGLGIGVEYVIVF